MNQAISEVYYADTKTLAVFAPDGPKPNFLVDLPHFKVLVVGLEAGQQLPLHPGGPAAYHFLEGTGLMTVDEVTFAIQPGVTVIAPAGASRGMNARTRVVFFATKGE